MATKDKTFERQSGFIKVQEKKTLDIDVSTLDESVYILLAKEGWKIRNEEFRRMDFTSKLGGKLEELDITVLTRYNEFVIFATSTALCADKNDPVMMCSLLEFMSRINETLKASNFDLSRNGNVRFKMHVDCSSCLPSERTVKNSFLSVIALFRLYSKGFEDIIFDMNSAEHAYHLYENCYPSANVSMIRPYKPTLLESYIQECLGITDDESENKDSYENQSSGGDAK